LRASTGTFASGFICFGTLSLIGAVAIVIVGRMWNTTFLTPGAKTNFAFAVEEG
jgi:hypothetical protein